MEEKKIRTIRWDGTCKKCGVKSYHPVVRVNGVRTLMCILCYWRAKKEQKRTNYDTTNGNVYTEERVDTT